MRWVFFLPYIVKIQQLIFSSHIIPYFSFILNACTMRNTNILRTIYIIKPFEHLLTHIRHKAVGDIQCLKIKLLQ